MLISVIIPHLNQQDQLWRCLESLHSQQGNVSLIEIMVVDNGSRQLPETVCAAWPEVRLLTEPEPGPGPARNRGIADARGDILAFIDADCTAGSGWLAAIEAAFGDPETWIIGGDVRVGYVNPARPSFLEPYESIYSYRNHVHIVEGFSGTGNLATLPAVVAHVGPFAGITVAEDRDWGLRAGALGYPIRYVPDMIVFHPARKSFAELKHKWDRHIAHDFQNFHAKRFGRLRWFARAVAVAVSPLFELYTLATSSRVRGLRERRLALLCLIRVRLYRTQRMISLGIWANDHEISGAWNRD